MSPANPAIKAVELRASLQVGQVMWLQASDVCHVCHTQTVSGGALVSTAAAERQLPASGGNQRQRHRWRPAACCITTQHHINITSTLRRLFLQNDSSLLQAVTGGNTTAGQFQGLDNVYGARCAQSC